MCFLADLCHSDFFFYSYPILLWEFFEGLIFPAEADALLSLRDELLEETNQRQGGVMKRGNSYHPAADDFPVTASTKMCIFRFSLFSIGIDFYLQYLLK